MKASELMLGDWARLRYKHHVTGEEVVRDFKVDQIRKSWGDREHDVWGSESGNMGEASRLEPIPLTSEILEKNGFTHCNYEGSELLDAFCWVEFNEARNGCMINRASIKVTLYRKPIMGVSVLTEIDTYSTKGDGVNKVHSCDIESVHELQHAIRLCGIKKEINL